MHEPAANEENLGAQNPVYPTAHQAQRVAAKPGKYECQACNSHFTYAAGSALMCPKCKTRVPDQLIPIHTEEDPQADEMLTRDDFTAG